MSAYIKTLQNSGGTITYYPQTKAEAVFMGDNVTNLIDYLNSIRVIYVSATQPSSSKAGDIWLEVEGS